MARLVVSLLVIAQLAACHPADPAARMRHAEWALAGGLVGIAASSGAEVAIQNRDLYIPVVSAFGALTITAFLVYLAADMAPDPDVEKTKQQHAQSEAWDMTKRAREAARNGDCDRVKKLAPAVKAQDAGFYDVVFMRDVAIQRCMAPPPSSPPAH